AGRDPLHRVPGEARPGEECAPPLDDRLPLIARGLRPLAATRAKPDVAPHPGSLSLGRALGAETLSQPIEARTRSMGVASPYSSASAARRSASFGLRGRSSEMSSGSGTFGTGGTTVRAAAR